MRGQVGSSIHPKNPENPKNPKNPKKAIVPPTVHCPQFSVLSLRVRRIVPDNGWTINGDTCGTIGTGGMECEIGLGGCKTPSIDVPCEWERVSLFHIRGGHTSLDDDGPRRAQARTWSVRGTLYSLYLG